MKKKTTVSELVTKEHFDNSLNEISVGFNGLRGDFNGLRRDFNGLRGDFVSFREEIRIELNETITKAMSKLYSRIDPLLSEVVNAREDRELTTEKLENHEKRIKKLERN